MNTSINVDNQQYQLFCTLKSNAPTYINATRTFNNGMDFFFGSDSDTVAIYIEKLDSIADFVIAAGADFSDEIIFDFILAYLIQNHKDAVDAVYQQYAYDIENYDIDFNDFEMMNNTDDDDILIDFIKLLSNNIPNVIKNQNGDMMDLNLMKECLVAV